jgi:hypothetical protein
MLFESASFTVGRFLASILSTAHPLPDLLLAISHNHPLSFLLEREADGARRAAITL